MFCALWLRRRVKLTSMGGGTKRLGISQHGSATALSCMRIFRLCVCVCVEPQLLVPFFVTHPVVVASVVFDVVVIVCSLFVVPDEFIVGISLQWQNFCKAISSQQ